MALKKTNKKKIVKKTSNIKKNKSNKKFVKKTTKAIKNKVVSKKKNVLKKSNKKVKNKIQLIKKKKSLVKKKLNKPTKLLKVEKKIAKKKEKKIINFNDYVKDIVTKLIEKNKVDGVYTSKIVEKAIPKKFRIPENISKVEAFLKTNNITILSQEEAAELAKNIAAQDSADESSEEAKKQTGKTDDPVRLYLRDMGSVELLSREGEIAIAKRIEAGRERMIGAICESPMTIRSIINWKESIKEGTMLLRDIVDLEQTYDMSDIGDSKEDDTLKLIEGLTPKIDTKEEKKDKKSKEDKAKEDEDQVVKKIQKMKKRALMFLLQQWKKN